MNTLGKERVTIARHLLPAGSSLLEGEFDLVEGGLECDRRRLLELVPGSAAIVADPTVPIDDEVLSTAGESLRLVANFAVGYDNVDLEACRRAGVLVTNTPDVLTNATAELALGLTLAAARRIPALEAVLREGGWTGWDPAAFRGVELSGATFGIVGMGRIGSRYAELVAPLAGRILYWSRSSRPAVEESLGAESLGLEEMVGQADVVSIHLPATPDTHHLFGRSLIGRFREGSILVNTARGSLVDSNAVAEALGSGRLGAAGLDVFEGEPEVPEGLLSAPGAVLTPHVGSATVNARDEMARTAARNVIAVLGGQPPLNPV